MESSLEQGHTEDVNSKVVVEVGRFTTSTEDYSTGESIQIQGPRVGEDHYRVSWVRVVCIGEHHSPCNKTDFYRNLLDKFKAALRITFVKTNK